MSEKVEVLGEKNSWNGYKIIRNVRDALDVIAKLLESKNE